MAASIRTSIFPDLSPEDSVSLETSPGTANMVTFVLEKASSITWWKAIEVYSSSGRLCGRAELQDDDNGPTEFSIRTTDLVNAKLILAKAKAFGIHTPMYELQGLTAHAGQRMRFIWLRDDHTDGPVAGFFRDLGSAVNTVTETVATVVETVRNTIGEIAKTIVETIGTTIANAIDWVGGLLGRIPGIGPFLRDAFHWVSTMVSAFYSFTASVVKASIEIAAGVTAGVIRVVGGAIGGVMMQDASLFLKGLSDVAASIIGPAIAVVGKATAFVQSVIFMQMGERALTEEEASVLSMVFRNSVLLYNVRVVDGFAGVFMIKPDFSPNPNPFTLGNTIYMKDTEESLYRSVLVHECVHVWQNQHNGQRYIADALAAQAIYGSDAYNWMAELNRGKTHWRDFNREAQAELIQDVFDDGEQVPARGTEGEFYIDDPIGLDVTFIDPDRTAFASDSIAYMRSIIPLVHWR